MVRSSCMDTLCLLPNIILTVLMVQSTVRGYPYAAERKVDPFVALANTLRQQELWERLEEQQPYGPFGRSVAAPPAPMMDSGYYYDYGRNGPTDEDLWQLEQIQRELGRAALVPFFGRVQRQPVAAEYRLPVDDRDDGLMEMGDDNGAGEWYDTVLDLQQAGYDPIELEEQQKQQEGQLLLDTLTQYLTPYDSEAAPEEVKRVRPETTQSSVDGATETITTTTTSTSTTRAPVHQAPKEKQPPVQHSQDGTPLGQKEFPMMRPATPQRHQWWASHLDDDDDAAIPPLDLGSRGHLKTKNSLHKPNAVSEDKLIQELDSLKMKKN